MKFDIKEFHNHIMEHVEIVSRKGTCLRKKVGAVLTFDPYKMYEKYTDVNKFDYDEYIISSAYNTCMTGDQTCEEIGCLMIQNSCMRTIHSEILCIKKNTLFSCEGKWLYITTVPCIKCFQFIIINGIKNVYYGDDSYWKVHPEQKQYIQNMAEKNSTILEKV